MMRNHLLMQLGWEDGRIWQGVTSISDAYLHDLLPHLFLFIYRQHSLD